MLSLFPPGPSFEIRKQMLMSDPQEIEVYERLLAVIRTLVDHLGQVQRSRRL